MTEDFASKGANWRAWEMHSLWIEIDELDARIAIEEDPFEEARLAAERRQLQTRLDAIIDVDNQNVDANDD